MPLTPPLQPPSLYEEEFLTLLNAARSAPAIYGQRHGLDLEAVAPAPSLRLDARLTAAARLHSEDMLRRRYFSHVTPEGHDPGRQLSLAGVPWLSYGQSLAAGYLTPAAALASLIIDEGRAGTPHRHHLLGHGQFRQQRWVGIGFSLGEGPYRAYFTVNTAALASTLDAPADTGEPMRFLTGLWRLLVGRDLPGDELVHQLGRLASGTPVQELIRYVASHPTALARRVRQWYDRLLGRPPAEAELSFYTQALRHQVRDEEVLARLAVSQAPASPDANWGQWLHQKLLGQSAEPQALRNFVRIAQGIAPMEAALQVTGSVAYKRVVLTELALAAGCAAYAGDWTGYLADTELRELRLLALGDAHLRQALTRL